jgi:hypothetical protein
VASVTPFLPALGPGLPDLAESGQWHAEDIFALRQLSGALKVGRTNSDFVATTSIPDLWAQPLSFLSVWRDRHHPQFAQVRAEWRGMLAVLGLADVLDLGTRVVALDLDELRQHPWAAGHQAPPGMNRNLMEILAEFCPNIRLSERQSWKRLGLIATRENKPLTLIVPTNLVCPAREYYAALPDAVTWRDPDTRRLTDPVASDRLSAAKAIALAAFIDHVNRSLEAIPRELGGEIDNDLFGALREALVQYLTDVRRLGPIRWTGIQQAFSVSAMPARLANIPFGFVTQAVKPGPSPAEPLSDAIMRSRSDVAGAEGAVFIHRDLAKMLGRAPDDFRIWGPYSLTDVLETKAIERTVLQQAASAGYAVLRSDDLFTDVFIEVEEAKARAHPESAIDCLLPLRSEVLRYLEPHRLRESLRVNREHGTIKVELDIALHDAAGQALSYTATKTYAGSQIRRALLPAALVTWPDFASPHWKRHFIFYFSEGSAPRPQRAVSARLFSGASVRGDAGVDSAIRYQVSGGGEVGIFCLDHRVEALCCDVHDARGVLQEAGLLLLEGVPEAVALSDRWEVAVDFGTTNTSIHYLHVRDDGAAPQEMQFKPRLAHPIGRSVLTNAILHSRFLRHHAEDAPTTIPFLSMLEESKEAQQQEQQIEVAPLIRQRVHFVRNVGATLDELKDRQSAVRFGLKWSDDPKQRKLLEAYLSQVCMQSLAELVAQGADPAAVTWSFSQPGSFSASHARAFNDICKRSMAWARVAENGAKIAEPKVRLESEAAALYFVRHRDQGVGFGETVFTLDIGGQTTDICLWHQRHLLWQTSVRFAGQHILIDYLKHHPEARAKVVRGPTRDEILRRLEEIGELREDATLTQALEVVVNSDLFDKSFELTQDPDLQQVAELSLAGLLYYLGMMVQHLSNRANLPAHIPALAAPLDVRICLGGRGSLLFKSVADQRELYKQYFSKVSGFEVRNLDFHMSLHPKHEVSFGMLAPREGAGKFVLDKTYDRCVLGESLQIDGKIRNGLDVLATEDLDKQWSVTSLQQFEKFLEVYAGVFRRALTLSDRVRSDLINRVEPEIQDLKSVLQSDLQQHVNRVGSAEPVFMFPLRRFVSSRIRAGG